MRISLNGKSTNLIGMTILYSVKIKIYEKTSIDLPKEEIFERERKRERDQQIINKI